MDVGSLVGAGALWAAVPIALLAGLASFLSPCVLPIVPGYLGFIAGAVAPRRRASVIPSDGSTESPSRGRLVGGVVLFIAGFTLVFVTIVVLGGMAGGLMQRVNLLYGDIVVRVLGVVIILLGLVFVGLFRFAQRTARPQVAGNLGLVGAPLLGIALGLGWAPCIGPTLGTIIAIAYGTGDGVRAGVLGLAYSLGLGIPFLLAALGFGWATRSIGFLRRHVRALNVVGGVLLIVLGALMVSGVWSTIMRHLQGVFAGVPTIL